MLLLADMFGLKYWMLKEENAHGHIFLVEEVATGKSAKLCLESGKVLQSDLDFMTLRRVQEELRTFRPDFLEYWNATTKEKV